LGKVVLDKVALKKKILKKYQELFGLTEDKTRQNLWDEIKRLERKL
jgi:hypothetical protein